MNEKRLAQKANIVFRKAQLTIDNYVVPNLREYGITHTQFGVLDYLYSKGEQKVGQILSGLLATSGNMTVVIKNMEKNGWVWTKTCPEDKRAKLVGLTEAGRALIERVLPEHLTKVEEAMSVLTDDEQEQLITLLKKFKNL
ncbi:MarR family winged helix-turn-helix transcriptional regulator [Streptococcus entericus]|uniref:MarR family winged helix-turn-helix transcriptional regulator n=1 Tax=Streptococcus entericus TaxID=155680 RepID=UPI000366DFBB|nr:MarR family transcriptional regulator [Streptococcus entericus]